MYTGGQKVCTGESRKYEYALCTGSDIAMSPGGQELCTEESPKYEYALCTGSDIAICPQGVKNYAQGGPESMSMHFPQGQI